MELELRFFANFRDAAGQKTITREYDDDVETVGDVLRELEAEFPEMEFFEDGSVREFLTIMRNGEDVTHIDGMETPIEDGDVVSAFPPVAGG